MQQQHRLNRNRQFSYVYRKGIKASNRDLTLLYVKNTQQRVGFSVSKKVGCAVIRNRTTGTLSRRYRPTALAAYTMRGFEESTASAEMSPVSVPPAWVQEAPLSVDE